MSNDAWFVLSQLVGTLTGIRLPEAHPRYDDNADEVEARGALDCTLDLLDATLRAINSRSGDWPRERYGNELERLRLGNPNELLQEELTSAEANTVREILRRLENSMNDPNESAIDDWMRQLVDFVEV